MILQFIDKATYLYIGLGSISLLGILFVLTLRLKAMAGRRRDAIDRLKNSESIPTATPLEKPLNSFKSEAKERISRRFSIFRKVAYFIIFLLIAIVVTFPFIDSLPKAFISILVTSAAVIVGIAAKPFIENFLSGIAITTSKMLGIGDTVILNGQYGKVEDISATHTIVKLWDWRRYVIPNSTMINQEFINYSLNDQWIWSHVEFWTSYEAGLEKVEQLAIAAVKESPYYTPSIEPPAFWVMSMEKEAIKCWVAAWASSPSDAWELAADIRKRLTTKLQKAGIRTHLHHQEYEGRGNAPLSKGKPF